MGSDLVVLDVMEGMRELVPSRREPTPGDWARLLAATPPRPGWGRAQATLALLPPLWARLRARGALAADTLAAAEAVMRPGAHVWNAARRRWELARHGEWRAQAHVPAAVAQFRLDEAGDRRLHPDAAHAVR
jgi:hypothetical protein